MINANRDKLIKIIHFKNHLSLFFLNYLEIYYFYLNDLNCHFFSIPIFPVARKNSDRYSVPDFTNYFNWVGAGSYMGSFVITKCPCRPKNTKIDPGTPGQVIFWNNSLIVRGC